MVAALGLGPNDFKTDHRGSSPFKPTNLIKKKKNSNKKIKK